MANIRKLLLAGAVTGLCMAGTVVAAQATPLNTTFNVSLFNYVCPSCVQSDTSQKALPINATGTPTLTFTYTGAMNFDVPTAPNTLGAFLTSGGGTSSPNENGSTLVLSNGSYGTNTNQTTTLMKFNFTIGSSINAILHDDGISLYKGVR